MTRVVALLVCGAAATSCRKSGGDEEAGSLTGASDPLVVSGDQPVTGNPDVVVGTDKDGKSTSGYDKQPSAFSITGPVSPVSDATPAIVWTKSTDAKTYDVTVGRTESCASPVFSATASALTVSVTPALSDGTYFACVVAKDADGDTRKASNNGWEFTVNSVDSGGFAITAPTSVTRDVTPEITWTRDESAESYRLVLDDEPTCSAPHVLAVDNLTVDAYSVTSPLANGSDYYVCVYAQRGASSVEADNAPYGFVIDTSPPAAPTISGSTPASPSATLAPAIRGTAEAGSFVRLFANSACSGLTLASGTAAAFAAPGLTITATSESTTTVYANASDQAGNVSACSSVAYNYVNDTIAPTAATSWSTLPVSPSSDNNPRLIATAEAGTVVSLWSNSSCNGAALATASATNAASPGIALTVAANSSTTIYHRVIDGAGNASACASTGLVYVEDSVAPSAPSGLLTTPSSPSSNGSPAVAGVAEVGSTVDVYLNAACTGVPAATGTASEFASPGLVVNVTADSTTQIYARATDQAGNTSGCATALTYVEDSTAPSAPSAMSSTPPSPANNNNPAIKGTAEAGSTVRLYSNSSCSSAVLASGSAATFNQTGFTITVADNTTTTIYATATDASQNVSACTSSGLTYQEDSTLPSSVSNWSSQPASPANDNTPEIRGTVDPNTTVRLYTTFDCSGTAIATGSSATFSSTGLTITVADNSTTTIYGTTTTLANNTSPCSTASYSYIEDSTPPAAPTGLAVTPLSPANDNTPKIYGAAENGSTVSLYGTSNCSGTILATGTAAAFASPGLTITVADNATTTIYAKATDSAGNASACSTAHVTFVEDSTGVGAPTSMTFSPGSPANNNAPRLSGSAEAGSTVKVYTNSSCTGVPVAQGSHAAFAAPGLTLTVADDTSTTFYATATDTAANVSACSSGLTYIEDSTAPATPSIAAASDESPSSNATPKLTGTSDADSTVSFYVTSDCSGAAIGSGSDGDFGGLGITVNVPLQATTSIKARANDAAGNTSACSSALTYTHRSAFMVKDIRSDSVDGSSPTAGVVMDGWFYFSASDGIAGSELWRTDGSTHQMVEDINAIGSSSPTLMTPLGDGTFIFTADDGEMGRELWRSTGSPGGLTLVKDIQEGAYASSPANFLKVGSIVYFTADDGSTGIELWRTDGTAAGTYMVKDINAGSLSSSPTKLTEVGGKVVFTARDETTGTELWVTDGTELGTVMLKDIRSGITDGGIGTLVELGGKVYFPANDGTNGAELWSTDGTAVGTVMFANLRSGSGSSSPANLVRLGTKIFFTANGTDGATTSGTELYATDGTLGGTGMVKNIRAGNGSSSPANLRAIGSQLFFRADDNSGTGSELWVSDGTSAGTVFVKDIWPGLSSASAGAAVDVGGMAFFTANDGTNGVELWRSDGTAAGTFMVKDLNLGSASSSPSQMIAYDGLLYFRATDASVGAELFSSDGTTLGTTLVADLNSIGSSSPSSMVAMGGVMYFAAGDGINGVELWSSDGTSGGTAMLKDINPGDSGSSPANLTVVGSTIFFTADDGVNGVELWKTDGTAAGTVLVKDINSGSANSSPATLVNLGGLLMFAATDATNGTELWSSDGTSGGTTMVKDVRAGTASSSPIRLTVAGSTLFFRATDASGNELWKSDGTSVGTVLVKDIYAGSSSSSPDKLTPFASGILFYANGNNGAAAELWYSDGTSAGTVMVKDINPGNVASVVTNQYVYGSHMYFLATTAAEGAELWRTDGTTAGTELVKDIRPGMGSSGAVGFYPFGGELYFRADDGSDGTELWKTDGTTAGTVQVADVRPGGTSSSPSNFVDLGGVLHMSATDAIYGNELRRLGGGSSVSLIQDLYPGAYSASPTVYFPIGSTLFFRANDGVNGSELWRY